MHFSKKCFFRFCTSQVDINLFSSNNQLVRILALFYMLVSKLSVRIEAFYKILDHRRKAFSLKIFFYLFHNFSILDFLSAINGNNGWISSFFRLCVHGGLGEKPCYQFLFNSRKKLIRNLIVKFVVFWWLMMLPKKVKEVYS